jgi:lipopolysaccharide/colanic/teichoic acid biosynthesis glycosyltransferase
VGGSTLSGSVLTRIRPAPPRLSVGSPQSGLPYLWRDGFPFLPERTAGRRAQLVCKRWFDIFLAALGLLFLSPLLLSMALAIRLTSPGRALFLQDRIGFEGRRFRIFKFRTMYVDDCDDGTRQAQANDARVTPIGRFMRATSIDELPQLLNVLIGDMSLVGPRPHVPGMLGGGVPYEELVPYYELRHCMRPGLTGWAQANRYRGPTDDPARARARVDHDIAYIQNFSLWLDLRTMLITLRQEIFGGGGF